MPDASIAINQELRQRLIELRDALAKREPAFMTVNPVEDRTVRFAFDGKVDDWGGTDRMKPLDEVLGIATLDGAIDGTNRPTATRFVDAAWDERGLYLAYLGVSRMGNAAADAHFLFTSGFAFDFQWRLDSGNRDRHVIAGDRRLVFGLHESEPTAVLYDYVDDNVPDDRWREFRSPGVVTRIARVETLSPQQATVKISLGNDLSLTPPAGHEQWSAEVFIPWSTLGRQLGDNATLKADFGILGADSGGIRVESRHYWSDPRDTAVPDLGIEAQIQPATFGTLKLSD